MKLPQTQQTSWKKLFDLGGVSAHAGHNEISNTNAIEFEMWKERV